MKRVLFFLALVFLLCASSRVAPAQEPASCAANQLSSEDCEWYYECLDCAYVYQDRMFYCGATADFACAVQAWLDFQKCTQSYSCGVYPGYQYLERKAPPVPDRPKRDPRVLRAKWRWW